MPFWNRFKLWLRAAPIGDPVDRRNAPVMQLLLMFYGVALPSAWAWHLSSRAIPQGWTIVLVLDLITSLLAFVCVAMIRRGRFRQAMTLFLGALLASLALAHYKLGSNSQLIDQSSMILTLVIGGLVLGRRALWTVYGLLMTVFCIGFTTDIGNANDAQWLSNVLSNAPTLAVSYFIITLVLDRTIMALRESLAESIQRGRELQLEMAERERAQARLIQAQKVEATGRLASGIAHDFNNILGLIVGYAGQRNRILDMEDRDAMETAAYKAFCGIEDAAHRGADITRKLLAFSRHDVAMPQSFAMGPAIANMQPMLRQLFPHSVNLSLPERDSPLQTRFDRSEFELMVLNIAANARDAMPLGGQFTIELSSDGDHLVVIELTDTGHGMDESVQRQIFDPFFSTKAASGGTGLGLAVVQDLVIAAGGDISVRSAPGKGTTFRVQLPAD